MTANHIYTTRVLWTGNTGDGTRTYRGYDRTWDIAVAGKPVIHCSNDPLMGGDPTQMNPEDLLLSALSACHMLWYLHLASVDNITVLNYRDEPVAEGENLPDGSDRFTRATLRPHITVAAGCDLARAHDIHNDIHKVCFIARSVNFPVSCEPMIECA